MRLPPSIRPSWLSGPVAMLSTTLFLLLGAIACIARPSPPIEARIQASWRSPPLLTRILETVSIESSDTFFPFLTSLGSPSTTVLSYHYKYKQQDTYDEAIGILEEEHSLAPAVIHSIELSLAVQEASALIETHYSLYQRDLRKYAGTRVPSSPFQHHNETDGPWLIVDQRAASLVDLVKPHFLAANLWYTTCSSRQAGPKLYPFDHVYPAATSTADDLPRVLLYADPTDFQFSTAHALLSERAQAGEITYVLRWRPPVWLPDEKLSLSGYGAGLDLKRVDYLTIDDRDLSGAASGAETGEAAAKIRVQEGQDSSPKTATGFFDDGDISSELVQLKPAHLEDLGLKAAQLVATSSHPFADLRRLSQDFPKYAYSLATNWIPTVNESIRAELEENSERYVDGGRSLVWLNGLPLTADEMKPLSLLRVLRRERQMMRSLHQLGLTTKQALGILAHPEIAAASAAPPPPGRGMLSAQQLGELFDASDRREAVLAADADHAEAGDSEDAPALTKQAETILYWNDIERDSRYRQWPRSLQALLQPMLPGQMPQVRRNLVTVILALDLSKRDSHAMLAENVATFISRGVGVRFGSVPLLTEDELRETKSVQAIVARVMWYLVDTAGRASAIAFSRELAQHATEEIDISAIRKAYEGTVRHAQNLRKANPDNVPELLSSRNLVLAADLPNVDAKLSRAVAYIERLGLSSDQAEAGSVGHFFVNGKLFPVDEEFRQNLQQTMSMHIQYLTQQLYLQAIDDDTAIGTYFYDLPETYGSRNKWIFPDEEKNPLRIINVSTLAKTAGGKLCQDSEETSSAQISIWIVGDFSQSAHQALAFAFQSINDPTLRICLVPTSHGLADNAIHSPARWLPASTEYIPKTYSVTVPPEDVFERGRKLAASIGLIGGDSALIVNGRIIGPFAANTDRTPLSTADIKALISYERQKRLDPLVAAATEVLGVNLASVSKPSFWAKLSSVVARAYMPEEGAQSLMGQRSMRRSLDYRRIPGNFSSVTVGNEEEAMFQFGVLLDPLSENAQTWSTMLEVLSSMSDVSIRLQLNPAHGLTELPLKRFYRYSLTPAPVFDSAGREVSPSLLFRGLPESTLLTLALDVPHAWQAFPKDSVHDLDNLRLGDLKPSARERGVRALFQLDNIIVEGHARESKTGAPPRGLQLDLKNPSSAEGTDTLVMANLGYHQLKANPGVWEYSIREGRSAEVFELEDLGLPTESGKASGDVREIAVTSLEGVTIFPRFKRREGMEGIDLLSEDAEQDSEKISKKASKVFTGVMDRVQSIFGGKAKAQITDVATTAHKGAEINIFTVASGLLYERMAMIMILSVLRHTQSSVKFWFINNFLSPSFKAFIPHLASAYGFEYELITYTWPGWLRSQKEKQRTIWGYKILFLDVLFPLELDRVIFVDSDQIVRTDLKQLVDMDLQGAPYAYAPMGDDREDMENYRFWKTGYWKDHLRGKPYHISALYVIDLDRFRQIAAGDRLRGQYQGLSADPNSLANLDQDLPNNMQSSLPIHTLDASWLWCETWCSDAALSEAKTIDLCNNPKTHEPKLARAKRLIPEWTAYDGEVAALAARVADEEREKASASSRAAKREALARARGVSVDEVELEQPSGSAEDGDGGGDSAANAFRSEAGQLLQARQQQVEFVEEGTGAEQEQNAQVTEAERLEAGTEEGKEEARPPRDEL